MHITARFPMRAGESSLATIVLGSAEAEEGQVVSVFDGFHRKRYPGLTLRRQHTSRACEVSNEDLRRLKLGSHESLRNALSRVYGTQLPDTVKVTVYEFDQ